jgi:hypothetical protein
VLLIPHVTPVTCNLRDAFCGWKLYGCLFVSNQELLSVRFGINLGILYDDGTYELCLWKLCVSVLLFGFKSGVFCVLC